MQDRTVFRMDHNQSDVLLEPPPQGRIHIIKKVCHDEDCQFVELVYNGKLSYMQWVSSLINTFAKNE